LDNLGKDICTTSSGVVGVGDSAEVYAVDCVILNRQQSWYLQQNEN
jgi:hypothetical protein